MENKTSLNLKRSRPVSYSESGGFAVICYQDDRLSKCPEIRGAANSGGSRWMGPLHKSYDQMQVSINQTQVPNAQF